VETWSCVWRRRSISPTLVHRGGRKRDFTRETILFECLIRFEGAVRSLEGVGESCCVESIGDGKTGEEWRTP